MKIFPDTKTGKWSVGLQALFLVCTEISVMLVNGFSLLRYNDRWWDIVVPILFSASIVAFILGVRTIRKHKDHSILVYVSAGIGLLVIIFIFLHSLFIND